jgi:hypothetical protein
MKGLMFIHTCILGIVAYPAGCTVVLYNPRKNKQQHITNPSRKTITAVGWWVIPLLQYFYWACIGLLVDQCCASRSGIRNKMEWPMLRIRDVYPGFWFLSIPDPGSNNSIKRGGDNFFGPTIFCSHKYHKIVNNFIFEQVKTIFLGSKH